MSIRVIFDSMPGMALIQLELNQIQVVTSKCSEPQVITVMLMNERSDVSNSFERTNRNLI